MRIATSTMTNTAASAMQNAYSNYANIINKIASNKNFTKVSENVPDAVRVLKLDDSLSKLNEYQGNIDAAINEMDLAYDALGDTVEKLSEIDALIIQASDATTTPESAVAIANDIKEKVNTIMDKMNTKYLDNYIFSGTFTEQKAYSYKPVLDENDEETGEYVVAYTGSPQKAGDRNITISEDTVFTYNLSAENILGKEGVDENGEGTGFFAKMAKLDEYLRTEPLDYQNIRSMLDTVTQVSDSVIQAQGSISSKVSKLDMTKSINESTITNLTEQKVNLEEVDLAKAASDLASAYTALQASYLTGSRVMSSVSLLDYI